MAEQEKEKPKPFIPQNRKGVSDWAGGGGVNYIGLSDYGRFTLAFKKLRFEVGQTKKTFYAADCKVISAEAVEEPKQPEAKDAYKAPNGKMVPAYVPMADDKYNEIIASIAKQAREGKYHSCWTDPTKKHVPGKISVISFPVGVLPTTSDPERADRDDRVLGEFLRVIQGMARGTVVDFNVLQKLVDSPAIDMNDDTDGVFALDCIPRAQPNVIVDPSLPFDHKDHVLRTSISVWPNRYYRLVG